MKPKPKVVIELFQRGAELKGRVLEMDEGLRSSGRLRILATVGAWKLKSWYEPDLVAVTKTLWLRGKECHELTDNQEFQEIFASPQAATEAVVAIRALLDKVNGVKPTKASKWMKVI
jgi:hypothetical protein